jgi:hypothetical protein
MEKRIRDIFNQNCVVMEWLSRNLKKTTISYSWFPRGITHDGRSGRDEERFGEGKGWSGKVSRRWRALGEIQGDKARSMEDLWKLRRFKNTGIQR